MVDAQDQTRTLEAILDALLAVSADALRKTTEINNVLWGELPATGEEKTPEARPLVDRADQALGRTTTASTLLDGILSRLRNSCPEETAPGGAA